VGRGWVEAAGGRRVRATPVTTCCLKTRTGRRIPCRRSRRFKGDGRFDPFGCDRSSNTATRRRLFTELPRLTDMSVVELTPPRIGVTYLPHQEKGIRWMLEREAEDAPLCRGGVLADDMGLGKTFQTIGLLRNSPFAATWRTLIVCPPALISGWTTELEACGFTVSVLNQGTDTWNERGDLKPIADTVWLTTYPRLVAIGACLVEHRGEVRAAGHLFQRIVLDEGHAIRNGLGTARGVAAWGVAGAETVVSRWILSATPVQNGATDWRNLCSWLRVDEDAVGGVAPEDVIMLRRTMAELRGDIAALPAPPRFTFRDLSIVRGSAEDRLFRSLCDQLEDVVDDSGVSALVKLELYIRIQQFLVHPQIYIQAMRDKLRGAYPRPDWTGTATKWGAFAKDLGEGVAAKEGTIVFCQFRAEMERVVRLAGRMGADVWTVRGGMSHKAVGDAVGAAKAAVEAGGKGVVIVVQIVAGGVGLNLQFCRRVLFLSQHWNPAVVHQAVGRAVRIGQKGVVDVVMYRCADDVLDNLDRLMVDRHLAKIEIARDVCDSLYEGFLPEPVVCAEDEDERREVTEDEGDDKAAAGEPREATESTEVESGPGLVDEDPRRVE
jgi:hypothetical protein